MSHTPLSTRASILCVVVGVLTLSVSLVWHEVFARATTGELVVAFLDVGQGDAIYIEAPNGNKVLIDGGKDMSVLRALGKHMAWSDRTIDVVIATHPDLDHIGGLPEVFARYEVLMFVEPCVHDAGADYAALADAVRSEGLRPVCAREGMTVHLDADTTLTILFPDRDVTHMDKNAASIVAHLRYGETSFLLTGDSPAMIEEYLARRYGSVLASDVLKLGHHGSKTSTSEGFLGVVAPEYAVVSAGCGNSYGHPHKEVMDRLTRRAVTVGDTCTHGTVVFKSDGQTVTLVR